MVAARIDDLKDLEKSAVFLDVAIKKYESDADIEALMIALRHIIEAQGGVGVLAKRTKLNRQNLYKILTGKSSPGFGTAISIIRGLGLHLAPTVL